MECEHGRNLILQAVPSPFFETAGKPLKTKRRGRGRRRGGEERRREETFDLEPSLYCFNYLNKVWFFKIRQTWGHNHNHHHINQQLRLRYSVVDNTTQYISNCPD